MLRHLPKLLIVGTLCGCVTTGSPTVDGSVPVERLRTESKSIVLVHTSLHDRQSASRCHVITATLAERDASGQYVRGQTVTLKAMFDLKQIPSRIELPAGEYGIVGLDCAGQSRSSKFHARVAKRGSVLDGSGTVYAQPIAQFKVEPGEVVDIGSLRLPSRMTGFSALGAPKGTFVGVVTAIPETWLKNLAEEDQKLYQARIVRPMRAAIRI